MITGLRIQNFKSWKDTGQLRLGALTGIFGTNSSGKTALLQMLLLQKQTVESYDRLQVLNTGDQKTYVDVGTFYDFIHRHQIPNELCFSIDWQFPVPTGLILYFPTRKVAERFSIEETPGVHFDNVVAGNNKEVVLKEFNYSFTANGTEYAFGMQRKARITSKDRLRYNVFSTGYKLSPDDDFKRMLSDRFTNDEQILWQPVKNYGFPDYVNLLFRDPTHFLEELAALFETVFRNIYYLGPLREYPHNYYSWSGERTQDVGQRGERAIPALLAAGTPTQTAVANWLKKLGLIHSFKLQPLDKNRKSYEVKVQIQPDGPEVLLTSVGFGISQILPVLALCYCVPEGATVLLEQSEIHLHPAVQAGLADVFIEVIQQRKLQIILESYSEHLLRRLQRRVAEKQLSSEQAALYFCYSNHEGVSEMTALEMDQAGNISNWPDNFFGDELGDLIAMTLAEVGV